jgi:TPR repeat protein
MLSRSAPHSPRHGTSTANKLGKKHMKLPELTSAVDSSDELYMCAVELFHDGQFENALEIFHQLEGEVGDWSDEQKSGNLQHFVSYVLGCMYRDALGMETGDLTKAKEYFQKCISLPEAMSAFAKLLSSSEIAEDLEKAVELYEKAAALGYAEAQLGLAVLLLRQEKDLEKCRKLLEIAAKEGQHEGFKHLAYLCQHSLAGYEEADLTNGIYENLLIQSATSNRDCCSCFALANLSIVIKGDFESACYWLDKASNCVDVCDHPCYSVGAMIELANLHLLGKAVLRDPEHALRLLERARDIQSHNLDVCLMIARLKIEQGLDQETSLKKLVELARNNHGASQLQLVSFLNSNQENVDVETELETFLSVSGRSSLSSKMLDLSEANVPLALLHFTADNDLFEPRLMSALESLNKFAHEGIKSLLHLNSAFSWTKYEFAARMIWKLDHEWTIPDRLKVEAAQIRKVAESIVLEFVHMTTDSECQHLDVKRVTVQSSNCRSQETLEKYMSEIDILS